MIVQWPIDSYLTTVIQYIGTQLLILFFKGQNNILMY